MTPCFNGACISTVVLANHSVQGKLVCVHILISTPIVLCVSLFSVCSAQTLLTESNVEQQSLRLTMPWQVVPSFLIIGGAFNVIALGIWAVDRVYYGERVSDIVY